jgi:hypothetical protein
MCLNSFASPNVVAVIVIGGVWISEKTDHDYDHARDHEPHAKIDGCNLWTLTCFRSENLGRFEKGERK